MPIFSEDTFVFFFFLNTVFAIPLLMCEKTHTSIAVCALLIYSNAYCQVNSYERLATLHLCLPNILCAIQRLIDLTHRFVLALVNALQNRQVIFVHNMNCVQFPKPTYLHTINQLQFKYSVRQLAKILLISFFPSRFYLLYPAHSIFSTEPKSDTFVVLVYNLPGLKDNDSVFLQLSLSTILFFFPPLEIHFCTKSHYIQPLPSWSGSQINPYTL